jgi:hypothetical protein
MSKFKTRPAPAPPKDVTTNSLFLAETVDLPPLPSDEAEEPKRSRGRPKLEEADKSGRKGFATRIMPDTLADIDAITRGLRLRSQGEVIERAVAMLKADLLTRVRAELGALEEVEALAMSYKVD